MAIEVNIKPEYEVVKDNGTSVITVKDENLFVEAAKEAGIEKKTLEEVSKFKEAYLAKANELAIDQVLTVMKDDESVKNAEVTTPAGLTKSTNIQTFVQREKTGPIPGTDKTYKKSVIKTVVNSREYVFPKTKRKALEQKLTDALLNV